MTTANPMNVARFGVDPKSLRTFFREIGRGYDPSFSTIYAMSRLRVNEPEATRLLVQLAEANWITYLGAPEGIDAWKLARLGVQFSMKDFLKRIPVQKAEDLLEKTIAAARAFNQTDTITRITRLALFGSLTRGGDDAGTVGDLDIELSASLRTDLSKEDLEALRQREAKKAPKSYRYSWERVCWVNDAAKRHLRAVNSRLTVSTFDNIDDMGCEHQIVYAYDLATGQEIPCDRRLIPADPVKQQAFNADLEHEAPLPAVPAFRPWPDAPAFHPAPYMADQAKSEVAQYFWQRGLSLGQISRKMGQPANSIQLVLSRLGGPHLDDAKLVITSNPITSLAPLLRNHPNVSASVRIGEHSSGLEADVTLTQGNKRSFAFAKAGSSHADGDSDCTMLAEGLAKAALAWAKKLRSRMPRVTANLHFDLPGGIIAEPPSSMKAAKDFATAFRGIFDDMYPRQPLKRYGTDQLRSLDLRFDLLRSILKMRDRRAHSTIIPHDIASEALDFLSEIAGAHADCFTELSFRIDKSEWV